MDFTTFLLYYLAIDTTISLAVFGVLYWLRRDIFLSLRLRLNHFVDKRIQFNKDLNEIDIYLEEDEDEDEESVELKPEMKAALDREFDL